MAENSFNSYRDPDTFDVRGSIKSVADATRQHKYIVLLCCLITVGIVLAYVQLFPPIYIVKAKIMVEPEVDNNRDAFYTEWAVFRKDDPRTEIELMTTPTIVGEVIKKEGLKYDDVYHPFLSHLSYVWNASWPGRKYDEVKDWIWPPRIDPDSPSADDIELGKTITDMTAGIKIAPVGDAHVGELTMMGPTRRVATMANSLLDTYLSKRVDRYKEEAQKNYDALDKEAALAAAEAKSIADGRLAFLQQNDLTFDLSKESQQLVKLVEVEDGIRANYAKAASLEASLQLVESQLKAEPNTKIASTVTELNSVREAARIKLLDLQTALIAARQVFTENSPEVQEGIQNIASVNALIANEPEKQEKASTATLNSIREDLMTSQNALRSQLEGTRGGIAVMELTAADLRARLENVPILQNTQREYDRQYAMVLERYQVLSAKKAQAAVSKAMAISATPSMTIVQRASAPAEPAWPKLKLLLPSALLVGLVLGIVAAQLRSLTTGRVRRADLERRLESPIYGTIRIPINTRPLATAGSRKTNGSNGSNGSNGNES